MSLIGGGGSGAGGAGNPVGGNPAGVGTSLNYIGDHVYANSGTIPASQTPQTILEFSTGSKYIVGILNAMPVTNFTTVDGAETTFQLSINDEVIAIQMFHNNASDTGGNFWELNVILPPYSNVKLEMDAGSSTTTYLGTAIFTGKVY
jgi:hypothetical protein